MEAAVELLKDCIQENGFAYLTQHAYATYEYLLKHGLDAKHARVILHGLLADCVTVAQKEKASLRSYIENECELNDEGTMYLVHVFQELFSNENQENWEEKIEEGFRELCEDGFTYHWEGFLQWGKSGVHVDCQANGTVEFEVEDEALLHDVLKMKLHENPFLSKEVLVQYLSQMLDERMDDRYHDYCYGDDYYEPWVEDFVEHFVEVSEMFAKESGLSVADTDFSGETSNWEPDF